MWRVYIPQLICEISLMLRSRLWFCTALALLLAQTANLHAALPTFQVRFDPQIHPEPFSGRVYLFASRTNPQPRLGPSWFHPEPFLSKEVSDWRGGETISLSFDDPEAMVFPAENLPASLAGYHVQAVVRFNDWERKIGGGPGNGYSAAHLVEAGANEIRLTIDSLVKERPFQETAWGKLLEVPSRRLSEFHSREVALRAAVQLPPSYYDYPERRYPTIVRIPGFGGDHRVDPIGQPSEVLVNATAEFIVVHLDPNFPWGHHVFANSDNNGPVGTAFVKEFLPALDQQFRTIPQANARFLTGHSSGGWSSLWLQVAHPNQFGGVWSTAPDPVDFRDFQNINIYQPGTNMWFDDNGEKRPLARMNGEVVIDYKTFDKMEQVLGHGGQLRSFEAVFGPRGADGEPVPLWNRETGAVDPEVAQAWRRYDINHLLKTNWPTLGPKLEGELHVFMGTEDTFYLEGATKNLKETLEDLGSDAVVELVPGADHFSLLTPELKGRILEEMTEAFLKEHPTWPRE